MGEKKKKKSSIYSRHKEKNNQLSSQKKNSPFLLAQSTQRQKARTHKQNVQYVVISSQFKQIKGPKCSLRTKP